VVYKDITLDCGYRIDVLVENAVIVELKAVSELAPIHQAQLLSYLKLAACPVGLLIAFNVTQLIEGIKRLRIYRTATNHSVLRERQTAKQCADHRRQAEGPRSCRELRAQA
jgi:hypothetical protein